MIFEHYSATLVRRVMSRSQERDGEKNWHWRGKPFGFWVSVKGEDDWPSWCNAEQFGTGRLGICHRITLVQNANVLFVKGASALKAFDAKYGRDEKLYETSDRSKRLIDWNAVAADHDGIIIAPYVWRFRLDGPISDWYYSWDCASGCIWNSGAIASVDTHPKDGDALAAPLVSGAVGVAETPNPSHRSTGE